MDKLVDFSQPVEAYHIDGTVVAGEVGPPDEDGDREFSKPLNGLMRLFCPDGSGWASDEWRIRNIAKPSTPSNEELTQRMEKAGEEAIAILRHMLAHDNSGHSWELPRDVQKRALSFVSDLPKPVDPIDPDLLLAREIAQADVGSPQRANYLDGSQDAYPLMRCTLAGIKAGRTLAAGGTAHE